MVLIRSRRWWALLVVLVTFLPACAGHPVVSVTSAPGFAGPVGARIGVTAFACSDQSFGNAVSDSLANALLGQGCRVLERSALVSLLTEQNLQVTGLTGSLDVSRIGELANVDYLLVGSVAVHSDFVIGGKWGYTGTVQLVDGSSARLLDAKTGEVVRSVTYEPGRGRGWHQPNVVGSEMANSICAGR